MTLSILTECTHTLETEESTFDSFRQHSSVENKIKTNQDEKQIRRTKMEHCKTKHTFIQGQ